MSSYIAGKAASRKAESMLSPLLADEDSSVDSDASQDSDASSKVETEKQTPMQKLKTLAVYVGLGTGVAASAAAMVFNPVVVIFVMGGLCVANAPYAAFKETKIGAIPSLRGMNNKLREDANNLGDQVDVLSDTIDDLEPEANRAAQVEEQLRSIADKQEVNVNKLVDLVKENGVILAKMRDNLRQRIVQDMITIVVKSDKDNDQTIDKNEAKTLALRIRLSLQEYDVEFDSAKFLKVIGENASVAGVIGIVQKLLPAEKPQRDDDDSDSDSDSDWDEDSDSEDDMYDMFHMMEDDKGCSAAGSMTGDSGGGMSLMKCDKKKPKRRVVHKY